MALFQNSSQPLWWADRGGYSRTEKDLRDLSHLSLLVFVGAAVATGILAGISLSSKFGIGLTSSFVVVAILFPLLCGLLAKEVWHTKKLEGQIKGQEATLEIMGNGLKCGDNTPAGLLILSPDMRVQFANQKYLESTLQEPEEVLGWKVQDILPAEALEEQANALLRRSDPAASCCFDTTVPAGLAGERAVHITMTRIAPQRGEDRVLVIIENLLPGTSARMSEPVEGYVC